MNGENRDSQKIVELKEDLKLADQQVRKLRQAWIIETRADEKIALEYKLEVAETTRKRLEEQLEQDQSRMIENTVIPPTPVVDDPGILALEALRKMSRDQFDEVLDRYKSYFAPPDHSNSQIEQIILLLKYAGNKDHGMKELIEVIKQIDADLYQDHAPPEPENSWGRGCVFVSCTSPSDNREAGYFKNFMDDLAYQLKRKLDISSNILYLSAEETNIDILSVFPAYLIILSRQYLLTRIQELHAILQARPSDEKRVFIVEWESMEMPHELLGLPVFRLWEQDGKSITSLRYYQKLDDLSLMLCRRLTFVPPFSMPPPSDGPTENTLTSVRDSNAPSSWPRVFLAQGVAEVVLCHAPSDNQLIDKMVEHLMPRQHQAVIKLWRQQELDTRIGTSRKKLEQTLGAAHIVLLLLTPAFLASEAGSAETQLALDLAGEKKISLMVLRGRHTDLSPYPNLESYLMPGMPVLAECNPTQCDEIFTRIARGIGEEARKITGYLERKRDELARMLTQQQITVLPEGPLSVHDGNEAHLREAMGKAKVFLQLLDSSSSHYAAFQLEQAKSLKLSILQWHEISLDRQRAKHPVLLENEVYVEAFSDFQKRVLKTLKPEAGDEKPSKPEIFVFVHGCGEDRTMRDSVSRFFREQGINHISSIIGTNNAEKEPEGPEALRRDLEENLRFCDALLLLYERSPLTWVREQLRLSRKIMAERDKPYKIVAVFRDPERAELNFDFKGLLDCIWPDHCLEKFVEYLQ